MSNVDWASFSAVASAVAAFFAATAAWLSYRLNRRQRRDEMRRVADRALLEIHQAVAELEDALQDPGALGAHVRAQLRLRGLVQVLVAGSPLPLTTQLVQGPTLELTMQMVADAMGEVENARAANWKRWDKKSKQLPF